MGQQRYFEDIELGQELGQFVVTPTKRLAVMFAGASGDFYEIHYDKDFAIAAGQPDVIVHGAQKAAFSAQVLTNWMGLEGVLKKVRCSFRGIDFFNVDLICNGKVTDKFVDGAEHCIECEVWIDNAKGERTTAGGGVVALPSRE
jgi:hydroxyacyl-ACP dehydratase HTD2-like protein with hotdog domain|tara:strand:- start:1829 stop:2260 length:432 start_codon:yes stop_codon:yes gene_type:complete